MRKCWIFGAAEFDGLLHIPQEEDVVIAADGGLRHLQSIGLPPHVILGDFDSLGYTPEGASVYPVEKDDTDVMLAAKLGLSMGCRVFEIYGGLDGPRVDHTVANFQMLNFLAQRCGIGYLVGKDQIATVLKDGTLRFPAGREGTISVFAMGGDACGIRLQGLYYPLENGTLTESFPLGCSNHFTGEEACIQVEHGSLLIIWDRQAGLPVL